MKVGLYTLLQFRFKCYANDIHETCIHTESAILSSLAFQNQFAKILTLILAGSLLARFSKLTIILDRRECVVLPGRTQHSYFSASQREPQQEAFFHLSINVKLYTKYSET